MFNPSGWVDPLGLASYSSNNPTAKNQQSQKSSKNSRSSNKAKTQFSARRGRLKAEHDITRNGYSIVAEEVTMNVNGSRIRADFVAVDGHGNYHIFEAKHGAGSRLTPNQRASGVFDMNNPSNNVDGIGGGTILSGNGNKGSFSLSTKNREFTDMFGTGSHDAIFHVLKY